MRLSIKVLYLYLFLQFFLQLTICESSIAHEETLVHLNERRVDTKTLPVSSRQSLAARNWIELYDNCGGNLDLSGKTGDAPYTTITVTITKSCLDQNFGNKAANVAIYGWEDFLNTFTPAELQAPSKPFARCHIIGRQLGGRGSVTDNLFPCYQNNFNVPVMRARENQVAAEVRGGATVEYEVTLEYGAQKWPDSVTMKATTATGNQLFHVRIQNTPAAPETDLP